MSVASNLPASISRRMPSRVVFGRLGFMIGATLILSTAIIIYGNRSSIQATSELPSLLEVGAESLIPYMLSAVIAAITAIAIMTILPLLKGIDSTEAIRLRLKQMATGDISSRIYRTDSDKSNVDLVDQLNLVVSTLGHDISEWKNINRRQWDRLEMIRLAANQNDTGEVLMYVERMERDWERIAIIEERLIT